MIIFLETYYDSRCDRMEIEIKKKEISSTYRFLLKIISMIDVNDVNRLTAK